MGPDESRVVLSECFQSASDLNTVQYIQTNVYHLFSYSVNFYCNTTNNTANQFMSHIVSDVYTYLLRVIDGVNNDRNECIHNKAWSLNHIHQVTPRCIPYNLSNTWFLAPPTQFCPQTASRSIWPFLQIVFNTYTY